MVKSRVIPERCAAPNGRDYPAVVDGVYCQIWSTGDDVPCSTMYDKAFSTSTSYMCCVQTDTKKSLPTYITNGHS